MVYLQEMELHMLRWIQSFATPTLDILWQCITMLGEETWMVLLFSYIYWCRKKEMGLFFSFALFTSLGVNSTLKNVFQMSRPIGEEGIRVLREHTATGYSFPSGHSQLGATALSSLGLWLQHKKGLLAGVFLSCLVAYSRMYLGVHYPKDVLVGLLLGWGIGYVCYWLYLHIRRKYLLFFFTWVGMTIFTVLFPGKTAWQGLGLFTGFVFGSWCEDRFIDFHPEMGSKTRKLFRWCLGVCGILGIKLILDAFPQTAITFVCGYALLSLFIYCIYPLLFQKLNL